MVGDVGEGCIIAFTDIGINIVDITCQPEPLAAVYGFYADHCISRCISNHDADITLNWNFFAIPPVAANQITDLNGLAICVRHSLSILARIGGANVFVYEPIVVSSSFRAQVPFSEIR